MKKPISVKLDERLWVHVKNKINRSKYIEELVKQDIQQEQIKPIVQSVANELLTNESFFNELKERLSITNGITYSSEKRNTEEFVPKAPDPVVGYDCCQQEKPCKHWVWDVNKALWINSLTGGARSETI